MNIRALVPLILCAATAPAWAQSRVLSTPWVEIGANGQAVARIIVAAPEDCPALRIDGQPHRMTLRTPVPDGFRPACEFLIPRQAKTASIDGHRLALPRPNPRRIVTFGDTGCRINNQRVQDCSDPEHWPLTRVTERAAAARPDLVIHVGDYLYREVPCPPDKQSFCGGTPIGDSWEAWNADFFTPAAALLGSAPWVLARGNHENCSRSWRGWFYYLDPRPWTGTVCEAFSPPYTVKLGTFELVVFDSSAVVAEKNEQQVRTFTAQLASLDVTHAWLIDHHPFWLLTADSTGRPQPQTPALQDAWRDASPQGIDLVVSGHVHLFEALAFEDKRPPQIVVGTGGTLLGMSLAESVNGASVGGTTIVTSDTQQTFGYALFTRTSTGWTLALRTPHDITLATCMIQGRQLGCAVNPAGAVASLRGR